MAKLGTTGKLVDYSGVKVITFPFEIDKSVLKVTLDRLGCSKIQVTERSNYAALNDACKKVVKDYLPDHHVSTSSLKNRKQNGLEVVWVKKGERANDYKQVLTANVTDDGEVTIGPHSLQRVVNDRIRDAYVGYKDLLPVGSVREVMATLLSKCDAVKIMSSLFWVPEQKLEKWTEIAHEFVRLKIDSVYTIPSDPSDPDTVKLVTSGIDGLVEKELSAIMQGITDNKLSAEDVAIRRMRVIALQSRLDEYEVCLGHTLGALQDAAVKADMALAQSVSAEQNNSAFAGVF